MKIELLTCALAMALTNVGVADEPMPKKNLMYDSIVESKMSIDEKEQYYNDTIDSLFIGSYDDQEEPYERVRVPKKDLYELHEIMGEPRLPRFNRNIIEPKLSSDELERRVYHIETLLDALIKKMPQQSLKEARSRELARPNENGYFINIPYANKEYLKAIQPNYLMPKVSYISRILYSPDYDISDFDYNGSSDQKFEKEYETIYLHIKSAGLLRKMPGAYYPKSLLREHADQTGLSQYIQDEEKKSNTKLEHDILAEQFFGSYDGWIHSFYEFLDKKIIKLNIGREYVSNVLHR